MAQELYAQLEDPRAKNAFGVQLCALEERIRGGASLVGWKVGLNSPVVQRHLDLAGPLVDYLTDDTIVQLGRSMPLQPDHQYLLEVEVFLILARDVSPEPSPEECRAAIGQLGIAIEVLDSTPGLRELEWILKNHTYHHAAVFGRTIAGSEMPPVEELSLTLTAGAGDSVGIDRSLGAGEFPEIVSFVARFLAAAGRSLHAGEKILCGALNPTVRVEAGQRVIACLRPFGELALDTAEQQMELLESKLEPGREDT